MEHSCHSTELLKVFPKHPSRGRFILKDVIGGACSTLLGFGFKMPLQQTVKTLWIMGLHNAACMPCLACTPNGSSLMCLLANDRQRADGGSRPPLPSGQGFRVGSAAALDPTKHTAGCAQHCAQQPAFCCCRLGGSAPAGQAAVPGDDVSHQPCLKSLLALVDTSKWLSILHKTP